MGEHNIKRIIIKDYFYANNGDDSTIIEEFLHIICEKYKANKITLEDSIYYLYNLLKEFDINGLSSGEKQLFLRALSLKFLEVNNLIILSGDELKALKELLNSMNI